MSWTRLPHHWTLQECGRFENENENKPLPRLAQILLDADNNEVLGSKELQRVIDRDLIFDRMNALLPDYTQPGPELEAAVTQAVNVADAILLQILDVGGLMLTFPEQYPAAEAVINAFLATVDGAAGLLASSYLHLENASDLAFDAQLPKILVDAETRLGTLGQRSENVNKILAVMRKHLREMMESGLPAGRELWRTIDPSLSIAGALQPTVLGIPIGEPAADGFLLLDKNGLEFSVETTLSVLVAPLLTSYPQVIAALLAIGSDPTVGLAFNLPIGEVVRDVLFPSDLPEDENTPRLNDKLGGLLDPLDQDWGIAVRSARGSSTSKLRR